MQDKKTHLTIDDVLQKSRSSSSSHKALESGNGSGACEARGMNPRSAVTGALRDFQMRDFQMKHKTPLPDAYYSRDVSLRLLRHAYFYLGFGHRATFERSALEIIKAAQRQAFGMTLYDFLKIKAGAYE